MELVHLEMVSGKRAWSQASILVAPKAILSESLSPTALRLYLALASFCREDETCWPSNRALLELLPEGTTERTIQKAKNELVSEGLLEVEAREAKGGRQTSNLYTLLYAQEEGERMDTLKGGDKGRVEGGSEDTPRRHNRNGTIRKEHVDLVFNEWVKVTGKTGRTRLDNNRKNCIEKALAEYPLEEVVLAVQGWKHSAFHNGKNDQGKVYDEITLILRNASQIEKFRDLSLNGNNSNGMKPKSWDTLQEMAKNTTPIDSSSVTA